MAKLKTDYQDDVLSSSMNGARQLTQVSNDNGTVSFTDSTEYDQEGDDYGAGDINTQNAAINGMMYVETTLYYADWAGSSAPYTQSVDIEDITADWIPGNPVLVSTGDTDTDIAMLEAYTCVSSITSSDGQLTFTCFEDLPEADFTVRVPGMVAL